MVEPAWLRYNHIGVNRLHRWLDVKSTAIKSQHVVPSVEGGWSVRQYGAARATRKFATQEEAVRYAKRLAEKDRADLYIHRKDGTIRAIDSFRSDPAEQKARH